jgi:hypothetical protein
MLWLFLILAFIVIFCICYFCGLAEGKKRSEIRQVEDTLKEAKETICYSQQKAEIKQEVFSDAETRKAELDAANTEMADGDTGRDRFDRINAMLRSKPEGHR